MLWNFGKIKIFIDLFDWKHKSMDDDASVPYSMQNYFPKLETTASVSLDLTWTKEGQKQCIHNNTKEKEQELNVPLSHL